MEKSLLNVGGMSCEHCVKTITKAVSALPGIKDVKVDLQAKTVAVAYDPKLTALAKIANAIEEQGFDIDCS